MQHAGHLEVDVAFVAVHVDRVEAERAHPPLDDCRSADQFQHGIGRGVVALDDHQLQQLARGDGDASERMVPRQDATRANVTWSERHLTIHRERALRDLGEQLERDRQLVDARHRKPLIAVNGERGARLDVNQRHADLAA
ncbi:MAG: hypothetical protein AUH43_01450 [Acidobacteria bacterium 13_1_40CM_65_14]|nr:MAG: hypothetical protein AUH43_01450 [Acidobacteria bacterium 13_1_40CM_65_14]OLC75691.1 MAG: hypothetical protein AUH72_20100 [Acidobacteria bacterium 13_1_40CM_4_65_8]